jgi:hypothetical protein
LCEAKEYAWRGGVGKYGFTNTLAVMTNRPLVCELGVCDRGEFGPMLVYDPTILGVTTFHGYGTPLPNEDKVNFCNMFLRATGDRLGVLPVHWDYQSPRRRLSEAELINWVAGVSYPVLVAGDFNGVASGGPAEITRDFSAMPRNKQLHKGRWIPGQAEVTDADTDALDYLLGCWNADQTGRVGGIGMVDLAEIAAYVYGERYALQPTINSWVDGGSGLRIDRALMNPAGRNMLVSDSFFVEIVEHPPSFADHRILRFKLEFAIGETC